MDKNSIIGIILIAGILIIYSVMNKQKRDSLEMVHQQQMIEEKAFEDAKALLPKTIQASDSANKEQLKSMFGSFADAAEGLQKFITIENDLLRIKVTNKGGRIYSVELKNYKTYTQKPLILFDGDSTVFGLNFFSQNRSIITNDLFFNSENEKESYLVDTNPESVKMRLYAGEGKYIEYV